MLVSLSSSMGFSFPNQPTPSQTSTAHFNTPFIPPLSHTILPRGLIAKVIHETVPFITKPLSDLIVSFIPLASALVDYEEETQLAKFKEFLKTYPSDYSSEEVRKKLLEMAPESLSDFEIREFITPNLSDELISLYPETAISIFTTASKFSALFKQLPPTSLEEFKDFIDSCPIDQKPTEIGKMIIAQAPEGFSLEGIIDFIFQRVFVRKIINYLNAILACRPSYVLSPLDQIRRAIVEDRTYLITNERLMSMLKRHELDNNRRALVLCANVAHRVFHPYIYLPSTMTIHPDNYTLNFLWVNLNPQDRIRDASVHIFKDGTDPYESSPCLTSSKILRRLELQETFLEADVRTDWNHLKSSFMYKMIKWADLHPRTKVNLWYDSTLVTRKAQLNTFRKMKVISQTRRLNLCLRDIRQLPNVRGEIEHSLHPGTNVYYRVDILKALITDHMISCPEEGAKYCVMIDVDVEPMNPQKLFDQHTLDLLSSDGYIFNRDNFESFENSFSIFARGYELVRKLHYQTIIQTVSYMLTYLRYHDTIDEENIRRDLKHYRFRKNDTTPRAEFVFDRYNDFLLPLECWWRRRVYTNNPKPIYSSRKVAKCPKSQFAKSNIIPLDDFKAEIFYFKGSSNVPLTLHGRTFPSIEPKPIEALAKWKAEPLPDPSLSS